MTNRFGFLVFPNIQQLDLTGPYEVFASAQDSAVHLVWKDKNPVRSVTGISFTPDVDFDDSPQFDVLCIPGGGGVNALLGDEEVLEFIRSQAKGARFITSVCTGSLVLGAAGLLKGKRAATHWNAMDFLPHFGATPVYERVVKDGNLITAGGVTSGIDFGLSLLAELMGREEAEIVQLSLEYAPAPPFHSGTPQEASPDVLERRKVGSRAHARSGNGWSARSLDSGGLPAHAHKKTAPVHLRGAVFHMCGHQCLFLWLCWPAFMCCSDEPPCLPLLLLSAEDLEDALRVVALSSLFLCDCLPALTCCSCVPP